MFHVLRSPYIKDKYLHDFRFYREKKIIGIYIIILYNLDKYSKQNI